MSTVRKVTYSLPIELVAEIDRRTAMAAKPKSALVAAALKLYFAERDREELENVYRMAARDPLFRVDNEAVLRDFAELDA
jgi:metal-responsive CopG/Arc/MetJ family transcriptional regulator